MFNETRTSREARDKTHSDIFIQLLLKNWKHSHSYSNTKPAEAQMFPLNSHEAASESHHQALMFPHTVVEPHWKWLKTLKHYGYCCLKDVSKDLDQFKSQFNESFKRK